MELYLVERQKGDALVSIFKHKNEEKYSFINLTKQHICSCKFNSKEEALKDMDKLIIEGKILKYSKL